MKLVCVCKSGGIYSAWHVRRLKSYIDVYLPDAEFICLSDIPEVATHPLRHGWPGWWSAIEAFTIPGPALYIDLAVVVRKSMEPFAELAQQKEFVALRDFNPQQRKLANGLMGWQGDMSYIYEAFKQDPERYMKVYITGRWWGDQGYIEYNAHTWEYWQDLLPGSVVSWKKDCRNQIPSKARIIFFHGKPKPWEIDNDLDA